MEKMSNEADAFVLNLLGFKEGYDPRPCYWCGVMTQLRNAEDFEACEQCQKEYIRLGYDAMSELYPLKGKDERNPQFFIEQSERWRERVARLTDDELTFMTGKNGLILDEAIQRLKGKVATQWDIELIGDFAEFYIDQK